MATAPSRAGCPTTATTPSGAWPRTRSRSWRRSAFASSPWSAMTAARARLFAWPSIIRTASSSSPRSTSCPPTASGPSSRGAGRFTPTTGCSWPSPTTFPERLLSATSSTTCGRSWRSTCTARAGSSRRPWRSTSAAARRSRSTACARTTAPPPPSTSRWTARTTRPATRSPARSWCCGATRATWSTHFKPREAWPRYATNVVGMRALPSGHYPQEQAPEETYTELDRFLRA